MSAWGKIPLCTDAEQAEALAGLECMKAVIPIFSSQLVVESDCSSLVAHINQHGDNKSAISGIVADIKRLLLSL